MHTVRFRYLSPVHNGPGPFKWTYYIMVVVDSWLAKCFSVKKLAGKAGSPGTSARRSAAQHASDCSAETLL